MRLESQNSGNVQPTHNIQSQQNDIFNRNHDKLVAGNQATVEETFPNQSNLLVSFGGGQNVNASFTVITSCEKENRNTAAGKILIGLSWA
jgi:hypothetical protein